ncbi:MAG: hypothetical protein ACLGHL_07325 [Actinomycetota bacterium]
MAVGIALGSAAFVLHPRASLAPVLGVGRRRSSWIRSEASADLVAWVRAGGGGGGSPASDQGWVEPTRMGWKGRPSLRCVLVVLMTSALVVVIWGVAQEQLVAIVRSALSSVCGSIGC